jgi:hypothetical protein
MHINRHVNVVTQYFHNTEVKVAYNINYTFPENIKYAKEQPHK